jgi:hypothetical protein
MVQRIRLVGVWRMCSRISVAVRTRSLVYRGVEEEAVVDEEEEEEDGEDGEG